MSLVLPPELTVARAAELRTLLLGALAEQGPLELDARGVVEVDVAGLQVLCAARRSARALGRALAFRAGEPGPALRAATAAAGLPEGWPEEADHG